MQEGATDKVAKKLCSPEDLFSAGEASICSADVAPRQSGGFLLAGRALFSMWQIWQGRLCMHDMQTLDGLSYQWARALFGED